MQYHRFEENDGLVMAFRRDQSPLSTSVCALREIIPEANYLVTLYHTYEPETPTKMKGFNLQNLKVVINDCPGSVIMEYRRTK
jgi:hypothetical protein